MTESDAVKAGMLKEIKKSQEGLELKNSKVRTRSDFKLTDLKRRERLVTRR